MSGGLLDFERLAAAQTQREPYTYICTDAAVADKAAADIRRDFPAIDRPGYLPLSKLTQTGAFADIVADLQSERLAQVLSDRLEIDLEGRPRMITVRRLSQLSDGPIHNDSKSKLLTMLLYLNAEWNGTSDGCIRVLNGPDDFDDYTLEVPPLAGSVFAFKRSDSSWHGHLPFEGERFVIQTTFLTSQAELDRKENRGGIQYFLKKLLPG